MAFKVLHSAAKMTPSAGQVAQMMWEQSAANILGIPWATRFFCPRGAMPEMAISQYSEIVSVDDRRSFIKKLRAWPRFRRSYYDWLLSLESEYDVLLVRYNFHDPFLLQFLRKAKRPVYLLHHTLEVPEMLSSHTVLGKIRGAADSFLGPLVIRSASGIVGVTREIADYEVKRARIVSGNIAVYPNGIEYDGHLADDRRQGPPQLLFVAGIFAAWHGLDVLLENLRKIEVPLTLHLVGQMTPSEQRLAQEDTRVRLYGHISRSEIASIAATCDVGISSLMLERNNMRQACTLKVREYLKLGLPVYAGYEDVFPENFQFYRNGPCDIAAMATFATEMRAIERKTVADAARPFIEKAALLRNLYDFFAANSIASQRI